MTATDELRDMLDAHGIEVTLHEPKTKAELARENAKLRELVRDMWFWHYEGHIDSESQERQMKHIDRVLDCMRELGVDE